MRSKSVAVVMAWIASAAIPALAVEGRVAIIGQTTIVAPGSYIVTQDFTVPAGGIL